MCACARCCRSLRVCDVHVELTLTRAAAVRLRLRQENIPLGEDATRRLAIVNLEWDRIKVLYLYCCWLWDSMAPALSSSLVYWCCVVVRSRSICWCCCGRSCRKRALWRKSLSTPPSSASRKWQRWDRIQVSAFPASSIPAVALLLMLVGWCVLQEAQFGPIGIWSDSDQKWKLNPDHKAPTGDADSDAEADNAAAPAAGKQNPSAKKEAKAAAATPKGKAAPKAEAKSAGKAAAAAAEAPKAAAQNSAKGAKPKQKANPGAGAAAAAAKKEEDDSDRSAPVAASLRTILTCRPRSPQRQRCGSVCAPQGQGRLR